MIALRLLAALSLAAMSKAALAFPDLYVMRHLEYRGEGGHARLSETGANSARRLATSFPLPSPRAIYVATEQVSLDTTAWLAIELGVTPKLFDPAKPEALMMRLRQERGPVLVVANRGDAAALIAEASGKSAPAIAEGEFGTLWAISPSGAVTRRTLPPASGPTMQRSLQPQSSDEGEIAERRPDARVKR